MLYSSIKAYSAILWHIVSYYILFCRMILSCILSSCIMIYRYCDYCIRIHIYIYYSISFYIMSYHTALLQSFFTIVLLKGMHSVWVYCRSIERLYNPTEACLYHWSSMQPDTIVVMCNMQFVDEAGSIAVRVYVCICNGTRTQQHDKNRYNAWTQTRVISFWCVLLLIFKSCNACHSYPVTCSASYFFGQGSQVKLAWTDQFCSQSVFGQWQGQFMLGWAVFKTLVYQKIQGVHVYGILRRVLNTALLVKVGGC